MAVAFDLNYQFYLQASCLMKEEIPRDERREEDCFVSVFTYSFKPGIRYVYFFFFPVINQYNQSRNDIHTLLILQ